MTDGAKNLGGRPRKELAEEDLAHLCEIQCTAEECGHILGMSPDTIDTRVKEWGYNGFSEFFKKHRGQGQKSLRRAQYETATIDRNPTMLVWLGKQILGQSDKSESTVNATVEHKGDVSDLELARRVAHIFTTALPSDQDDGK